MKAAAALLCLLLALAAAPVHAEKRVALVIGNSAYTSVSRLPNAKNDAEAIAAALRTARFEVVELKLDLGIRELRRAVGDFADVARDADIAVVYYAGHGIEIDGTNYLIPVDARLVRDFDVEDEALSLDRVVRAIDPARKLRLVILDACRDNPFLKTMKRSVGTRSLGRGLAKVEPTVADTLIAFSAKAGSVALDGDGANSPFTAALVKHVTTPGLDIRIAFGRVRDDVLASTKRVQEPFVYGSLGGRTIALVAAAPAQAPAAAARPSATVPMRDSLAALLALGAPARGEDWRQRVVADYEQAKSPKAIALAPAKGSWQRSRNNADSRAVVEETLEGCQIFWGQPCALLAIDDAVVSDASGNWRLQDMARVRYAGTFDPERMPVSSWWAVKDPYTPRYQKAAGSKVVVVHPRGFYYYESGHPDQRTAEERAFARCDAEPKRGGKDGRCYLYAVGDQVVLPKRITKATAAP